MVLEGVHLVPGMVPRAIGGALVVQCVLAVQNEEKHARHFWVRDAASEGLRPLERYLAALGDIRRIQSFLVERAEEHAVAVVQRETVEEAIAEVMDLVLAGAELETPSPLARKDGR